MQRCQHSCGCEGNAVGRHPESRLMLCAGCMGRSILGTDCALARKYFGHVPVRFVSPAWADPPPLRNGDRSGVPAGFDEAFLTIRTDSPAPAWDFMPLALATAGTPLALGTSEGVTGAGVPGGPLAPPGPLTAATNPNRPPKDPPPGPLPPPPGRPAQPNPPKR